MIGALYGGRVIFRCELAPGESLSLPAEVWAVVEAGGVVEESIDAASGTITVRVLDNGCCDDVDGCTYADELDQ